jgi:3-oxoadipate enol-lactonase
MWDPLLPLLRERYDEVVAYDHPGHGTSAAGPRTLEGFANFALARLPDEPVAFCGISLGGMVGLWLAAHTPARLARLVLCCTSPRFGTRAGWEQRARLVRERGMTPLAESVLERWFTPAYADRARYRDLLLATPPEGYARACEAIGAADLRPDLECIDVPTLVVAGSDDPAVSDEDVLLLATIRGASVVRVPGRHLAPVEHPGAFLEAL